MIWKFVVYFRKCKHWRNGTFSPPNHATFLHNIFRKMIREGLILIFEAKMINISSHYTVWKFKDFSATHNLREIRLSNCGISKLPYFDFFSGSEFLNIFVICNTFKCQFLKISKIKASKLLKFEVFDLLKLLNLISRKIWVAEKLSIFHSV